MANGLRRITTTALRWVGFGPAPLVGISYDDRFVVTALVTAADRRVGGVCVVELGPRVVTSGSIERPLDLIMVVRQAIEALRPPLGAMAGASLPSSLDHRGADWPAEPRTTDPGQGRAVLAEAAQAAGVQLQSAVPFPVVAAHLGSLAAADRRGSVGSGARQIGVVARSGWLCATVVTGDRFVECRTERNDDFRSPPDVRWGLSSERSGAEVDPFRWPKPVRDQRQLAMLAAGAAVLAGPPVGP